jgi:hypothetical protein
MRWIDPDIRRILIATCATALVGACSSDDEPPATQTLEALAFADAIAIAIPIECEEPLIHDLPAFAGSCEFGTTRCNGNSVEICGNDASGYLSWEHVATCSTVCVGDGSCGAPDSAPADLSDAEVDSLFAQVEAECLALYGDPWCGLSPTPVDPSGSVMAAILDLESNQGEKCSSCYFFSDQPCSCDPIENPSTFCYSEDEGDGGLDPGGPWGPDNLYFIGAGIKIAKLLYKVGKGGAKIAGFSRKFLDHYKKAQTAYDKSMVAHRAGNKVLAKALARESLAECVKATAQLGLATTELVLTGAAVREGLEQLRANPDANNVTVTVDGQKVNMSREEFNNMARQWKGDLKEIKKQVTELEKLQTDADAIIKEP